MCQLLALSCAEPTDVTFSFTGFTARGGLTDHHVDGWGVAFYEDVACRLFIDDKPACQSPMADFLKHYPLKSRNVIAHIRKATQGATRLENCHPFMRELRGQQWVFAHNGDVKDFALTERGPYLPVGTTDSEVVFCEIMNTLYRRFDGHSPSHDELFEVIGELTAKLVQYGIINFLLSNGEVMFANCTTRLSYVVRGWPFDSASLIDADWTIDFGKVATPKDLTVVIATTPLTDEAWTACGQGDLLMFVGGELKRQSHCPVPARVLAMSKYSLSELSAAPAAVA